MIRLVFIIIAFLMLVGAVIGGLYFWGIDPLAKLGLVTAPADPNQPAQAAQSSPPSYVDFGLLIVPVVQDREIKKQVEMILRLQVADGKRELVAHNLPRLQHAYLQDMMSFLPGHLREGQPLDLVVIRRRMVLVADRALEPGLVKDVMVEYSTIK